MAKENAASKLSAHIHDELDEYIVQHSLKLHPAQKKLIEVTSHHPHARLRSHSQCIQLQQNMAKLIGVKKAVEIGTFTGYGALSIALILPEDGYIIACDVSDEYANLGKPIWKEAGVDDKIDLRIGPATETLQKLLDDGEEETFDYAFIDADKQNYDAYYELCLKLVRPGGLIFVDNTLWGTKVLLNDAEVDERTFNIKALNRKIATDERVRVSFLRMGDGLTVCFKQ